VLLGYLEGELLTVIIILIMITIIIREVAIKAHLQEVIIVAQPRLQVEAKMVRDLKASNIKLNNSSKESSFSKRR
jgi:hypothetical protein